MKLQLTRFLRVTACLIVIFTVFSSCKKEKVIREVDAFAKLNNRISYVDGQYIISFSLSSFKYKKVTVRLSSNIDSFYGNDKEGHIYTAVLNENHSYKVFLNPLMVKHKYYYQVTVEDMFNSVVLSDVFSFTTQ